MLQTKKKQTTLGIASHAEPKLKGVRAKKMENR